MEPPSENSMELPTTTQSSATIKRKVSWHQAVTAGIANGTHTYFHIGFSSMAEASKPSFMNARCYQRFDADTARQPPVCVV